MFQPAFIWLEVVQKEWSWLVIYTLQDANQALAKTYDHIHCKTSS